MKLNYLTPDKFSGRYNSGKNLVSITKAGAFTFSTSIVEDYLKQDDDNAMFAFNENNNLYVCFEAGNKKGFKVRNYKSTEKYVTKGFTAKALSAKIRKELGTPDKSTLKLELGEKPHTIDGHIFYALIPTL